MPLHFHFYGLGSGPVFINQGIICKICYLQTLVLSKGSFDALPDLCKTIALLFTIQL
jgi:hypothetical protein